MSITAGQLAERIGARVLGDESLELDGVAKIEEAGPREVTFVANPAYRKYLAKTRAGAVILAGEPGEGGTTWLLTEDPYGAFMGALRIFHPEPPPPAPGVHPSAVVAETVHLGENVSIGPLCVLEEGVTIGEGTVLRSQCFVGRNVSVGAQCLFHSRVSIREGCRIGDRVILQDGAVVGSDGFGFAPGEEGYLKIPQVGIVVIEDDVELGANTTIDRATLGETRIERGVKLDNLVQIAHNVVVGADTVVAAQSGVAGSTTIGRRSMFGGQVGISGHLRLSDGIKAAAKTGLHRDFEENTVVAGYPAREINAWHRIEAALSRLPDLFKRVRNLEGSKD